MSNVQQQRREWLADQELITILTFRDSKVVRRDRARVVDVKRAGVDVKLEETGERLTVHFDRVDFTGFKEGDAPIKVSARSAPKVVHLQAVTSVPANEDDEIDAWLRRGTALLGKLRERELQYDEKRALLVEQRARVQKQIDTLKAELENIGREDSELVAAQSNVREQITRIELAAGK